MSDVDHLSMCWLVICMSLESRSLNLPPTLISLSLFLKPSSMSCYYVLEINPVSVSFQVLSPVLGVVFLFVLSIAVQELLSLIRSRLFIFVFIFIALGGGSNIFF